MGFFDSFLVTHLRNERDKFERDEAEAVDATLRAAQKKSERLMERAQQAQEDGNFEKAIKLSEKGFIHELGTLQFRARKQFGEW